MDLNTRIPKPNLKPPARIPGASTATRPIPGASATTKPSFQPLVRPMLRRRSKSMADLRPVKPKTVVPLPTIKKPTEKPTVPKVAQKRPALLKIDDENKPKVAKVKIPDWDYKARFHDLQKRHSALQAELKELKPKIANLPELEAELGSLREKHKADEEEIANLNQKQSLLVQQNKDLSKENFTVKNKLFEVEKFSQQLQASNDELQTKIETALQNQTVLTTRLSETETKLKDLKKKHETLQTTQRETLQTLQDAEDKLKEMNTVNATLEEERTRLVGKCESLEKLTKQLRQEVEDHDNLRRVLHNTIQDMKGNIRVFCRVRPPVTTEEAERQQCSIFFPTEAMLEIRKSRESVSCHGNKGQDLKQEFIFDKVFPPEAQQTEVFEELSQLVQSALDGYHVCVFAYGQTGSGKTYTMQGSAEDRGMIPRTIDLIFEKIKKLELSGWRYEVAASFLEIYNENIRDLLVPESTHNFELRYNEGRGVTVTNLRTLSIGSSSELKELMEEAHKNRAVAATDFNEHSSRSHAVIKIQLEGYNSVTKASYAGSINLVDLAGSESAKTSAAERLVETKNINKSLSTLGNVMLALHNKDSHVPYRNSKLTFLLQSCLGGNSKTLMFVNISPFEDCFNESINSLRFALKVKDVKTVARKNKMYCPTQQ